MSRRQLQRGTGSGGSHEPDVPGESGQPDAGLHLLHVDMDAFYASVELRTRPELKGTPVIVGGSGSRGVVLSATYEARRLGVHSAMPMSRARRLAPRAVVIEPDHRRYAEVSRGVMALFASITPLVEPLSLDEAFLDVSGALRRLGPATTIATMIRARVHDEQGITCSVGVAASKFVAKLASTRAKPDGMIVVPVDGVVAFLHPLPVGALWGVGDRTEEQLTRLGLRTVGDIANTPVATLQRALGQALGSHLAALAWGRDERRVIAGTQEKSVGAEETFARDVDDIDHIHTELLRLSERVARRARAGHLVGRTVVLKVRFADFTTITRSRTLPIPIDTARDLFATVRGLYEALGLQRARIRLVGVRLEGLLDADEAPEQLLIDAPDHGWRDAERAVDRATARFGGAPVVPARLVPRRRATPPDAAAGSAGTTRRSGPLTPGTRKAQNPDESRRTTPLRRHDDDTNET